MDLVHPKWLDMTMVAIEEKEVVALGVGIEEDTMLMVEALGDKAILVEVVIEGVEALEVVEATEDKEEDSKVGEIEGVGLEEGGVVGVVTEEISSRINTKKCMILFPFAFFPCILEVVSSSEVHGSLKHGFEF